jgi:hypothetical protein
VDNPVDNLRTSPSARPAPWLRGVTGANLYSETSIVALETIDGLGVARDVMLARVITAR